MEAGLLFSMYTLTFVGITVVSIGTLPTVLSRRITAIRVLLTILGSMAYQDPLIHWVSNHRRHRQSSEQPGNPHSLYFKEDESLCKIPGLWHSDTGWTFTHEITNTFLFAKDLCQYTYNFAAARTIILPL